MEKIRSCSRQDNSSDAEHAKYTGKGKTMVQITACFGTQCTCRHYRGADKSLDRPTSRYILFDGENISFDTSIVI